MTSYAHPMSFVRHADWYFYDNFSTRKGSPSLVWDLEVYSDFFFLWWCLTNEPEFVNEYILDVAPAPCLLPAISCVGRCKDSGAAGRDAAAQGEEPRAYNADGRARDGSREACISPVHGGEGQSCFMYKEMCYLPHRVPLSMLASSVSALWYWHIFEIYGSANTPLSLD